MCQTGNLQHYRHLPLPWTDGVGLSPARRHHANPGRHHARLQHHHHHYPQQTRHAVAHQHRPPLHGSLRSLHHSHPDSVVRSSFADFLFSKNIP